jgi:hypothetical protein
MLPKLRDVQEYNILIELDIDHHRGGRICRIYEVDGYG